MVRLVKLDSTQYAVMTPYQEPMLCQNLCEAETIMADAGVAADEFYMALDEMSKRGHDLALFGINRMFIFTKAWTDDYKPLK